MKKFISLCLLAAAFTSYGQQKQQFRPVAFKSIVFNDPIVLPPATSDLSYYSKNYNQLLKSSSLSYYDGTAGLENVYKIYGNGQYTLKNLPLTEDPTVPYNYRDINKGLSDATIGGAILYGIISAIATEPVYLYKNP